MNKLASRLISPKPLTKLVRAPVSLLSTSSVLLSPKYDVVVLGASGYVGRFVCEELHRLQQGEKSSLRWAAAGRNKRKVKAALRESGVSGVDVLVADVSDQDSLEAMCAQATVVIDTVGPYILYGEPVVKACLSQQCNFVDTSGELLYMESIEAKYQQQAREAGVYIVSACGFDSIPNDMGALMVQRSFNGDLAYIESYLNLTGSTKSTMNTGTWESALRIIRSLGQLTRLRKEQNHPKLRLPNVKPPWRLPLFYSDVAKRWCGPFMGTDVVTRSMRYRQEKEGIPAFRFQPYFGVESFVLPVLGAPFVGVIAPMLLTEWGVNMLIKYPKFFTAGFVQTPTRESLKHVSFTNTLVGRGYSPGADRSQPPDRSVTVKVKGIDPGYGATSAMLVQSALAIVYEKEAMPQSGGVYTPAVAFGNTNILKNITETGKVKFELVKA